MDCAAEATGRGVTVRSTETLAFERTPGGAYELSETSRGWHSPEAMWEARETYYWEDGRLQGCAAVVCASCRFCGDGRSVDVDCGGPEAP